MNPELSSLTCSSFPSRKNRGSVMITALVLALILAISLTSYLKLSNNSLTLANRTFFADSAGNVAEAGLEEAVWMFNSMGSSTNTTANTALWTTNGWTCSSRVADVYMQSMGSGYSTIPSISFSGGGGSGAEGVARIGTRVQIIGGVATNIQSVLGITITSSGTGYTSAPTVSISGGGGNGAVGRARFAATRTISFADLGANATGTTKVSVAGYDGSSPAPTIVSKGTITLASGAPVDKIVKVIVSKNGIMPKIGVVAKNGINWNGHPDADSYVSSAAVGVPPFSAYDPATARANTTVASLYGPTVDLSNGTVEGNVMVGAGVTVTGGTITGERSSSFTYDFTMPDYPTNTGSTAGYVLTSIPSELPRTGATPDVPQSDGVYYYYVTASDQVIQNLSITAGKKVVIAKGTASSVNINLGMAGNVNVLVSGTQVGSLKVYMDGPLNQGNGNVSINTTSWAGALNVWTTTTQDCTFSGNGSIYCCLFAPFSELVGNGGGNDAVDMCGSFVVKSVRANGHMSFHWDEGLASTTGTRPWALALWTELQSAADRATHANALSF